MGCDMARQCHLNTCPTGIATQREDLRAKFSGTPEQVIAYFTFSPRRCAGMLAELGVRTMDEIVGRNDLLERVERPDVPRAQMLDLSVLLARAAKRGGQRRATGTCGAPTRATIGRGWWRSTARSWPTWSRTSRVGCRSPAAITIQNHHLAVGARVAGAIAERNGDAGLPAGSVRLRFSGTAGQSFGAFTLSRGAARSRGRGQRLRRQGPERRGDHHSSLPPGRVR